MARTRGDRRRRVGGVVALVGAAVLGWPGTAYAAGVTTTPSEARRGDAVRLEFVVPEERPGTRTRQIEVQLPPDSPIAEVYPMSVPGWAPRISSRTLATPVAGLHASGVSTATTAVTWIRVGEAEPGPARLSLSMGPLPDTDRIAFPVIQTYVDGTVVRWTGPAGSHPAPVLTLLPAAGPAGAAAGHAGHGGAPGAADAGAPAGPAADAGPLAGDAAGGGNADALLAAGLLAGLGGGAAIGWLASRWRRRSPTTATATATATADTVDHEVVAATRRGRGQ
ncbi:YcnI family protein [Micromonospora sp. URMC 103]|uniref:YcnI family protein n=1 Tax=Micromonospora sp. URMC 103 TaxID=3423406 RepID=UPI003F1A95D1